MNDNMKQKRIEKYTDELWRAYINFIKQGISIYKDKVIQKGLEHIQKLLKIRYKEKPQEFHITNAVEHNFDRKFIKYLSKRKIIIKDNKYV